MSQKSYVCRICLNRVNNFSDLFQFSKQIMECAPTNIIDCDGFPNKICEPCVNNLEIAYQFRHLCLQSDSKLRAPKLRDTNFELYISKNETLNDNNIGSEFIIEEKKAPKTGHFICKFCNHKFKQSCNLQRHERIHTGEKPFNCDTCFRSFAQEYDCVKHKRIHYGDQPYRCDI